MSVIALPAQADSYEISCVSLLLVEFQLLAWLGDE